MPPTELDTRVAAGGAPTALLLRAATALLDIILPPRCLGCGQIVQDNVGFCPDCWSGLHFIDGPACARCDTPLPQAQGIGALCGACLTRLPPYDRVLAPLAYGRAARDIVMRFKYGRRVATAAVMARLMEEPLRRLLDDRAGDAPAPAAGQTADDLPLLVPVPLHRWRLWWRGFNQAAVLAQHLAKRTHLPMAIDALVRTRSTGSMRGRGRVARARQVSGAFALTPRGRDEIDGRQIILIDDVFTTGATAATCAKALLAGGARQVSVIAFARVLDVNGAEGVSVALTAPDATPIS